MRLPGGLFPTDPKTLYAYTDSPHACHMHRQPHPRLFDCFITLREEQNSLRSSLYDYLRAPVTPLFFFSTSFSHHPQPMFLP